MATKASNSDQLILLITGPESSGKTSLSKAIADQTDFVYLSEYARDYLTESEGKAYAYEDLEKIALGHIAAFEALKRVSRHIVMDTFLLNLKIWSEFRYGRVSDVIIDNLDDFKPDLSLLLRPDIPWVADGLRDNPKDRHILFDLFEGSLQKSGSRYLVIGGERRMAVGIEAARDLLI